MLVLLIIKCHQPSYLYGVLRCPSPLLQRLYQKKQLIYPTELNYKTCKDTKPLTSWLEIQMERNIAIRLSMFTIHYIVPSAAPHAVGAASSC